MLMTGSTWKALYLKILVRVARTLRAERCGGRGCERWTRTPRHGNDGAGRTTRLALGRGRVPAKVAVITSRLAMRDAVVYVG